MYLFPLVARIKKLIKTLFLTKPAPPAAVDWETVQSQLADIPAETGIEERQKAYAPYFLRFGKDIKIEEGCRFSHPDRISLDDNVQINIGSLIYGSGGIHIGRHARIGPRCFIHSANHDIASNHQAFFESGYIYENTKIGDNCLISANVSILPGARLGAGCFVACGAVVTRNEYPEGSKIMGVPARTTKADNRENNISAAPSIALLVRSDGHFAEAAKLLISSLGLPQVKVFFDDRKLPSSVHSIVNFDSSKANITNYNNLPVWQFVSTDSPHNGVVQMKVSLSERNNTIFSIPASRIHTFVPTFNLENFSLETLTDKTFYYCYKRIKKRQDKLSNSEVIAWYVLFLILKLLKIEDENIAQLYLLIKSLESTNNEFNISVAKSLKELTSSQLLDLIRELIINFITDVNSSIDRNKSNINKKLFLLHPEIVVYNAISSDIFQSNESADFFSHLITVSKKTVNLSYLGIAAYLLGNSALIETITNKLIFQEFYDRDSGSIRNAFQSKSYCYSPVLTAFLLIACRYKNQQYYPKLVLESQEILHWHIFENVNNEWSIQINNISGSPIDTENRKISISLLENWLKFLSVPHLENAQYELKECNYQPHIFALEAYWLALFKYIQNSAQKPSIQLKPYPYGYHGALSIRYDVDRNTLTEQVNKIIEIQRCYLNANCGSWYLIPDSNYGDRLCNLLPRFLQETGIHALNFNSDFSEKGVTFHSSPDSEYWRGEHTVLGLEVSTAKYGEMLASQLIQPKPAWLGNGLAGRRTKIWLLPIHFPLEGTTQDSTLEYFDRLKKYFLDLLEIGGYIIIGSHPDLNQDILIESIKRENLKNLNLWLAPVETVVERCQKILDYGNISVVENPSGSDINSITLLSLNTVADVHLKVYFPDCQQPISICTQLNANTPRVIDIRASDWTLD